jgi:hypothetical protein
MLYGPKYDFQHGGHTDFHDRGIKFSLIVYLIEIHSKVCMFNMSALLLGEKSSIFAKYVRQSSMSVCLSVKCLLARFRQNYGTDFDQTSGDDWG